MLKKFICLLILILAAGCVAKSKSASEPHTGPSAHVLKEIAASRWELDIDASMQVDSSAREAVEAIGMEEFMDRHGGMGFSLDLSKRNIIWYTNSKAQGVPRSFVATPETAEEAAERASGVKQAHLIMVINAGTETVVMRYADNGKLLLFLRDKLHGVFVPQGK